MRARRVLGLGAVLVTVALWGSLLSGCSFGWTPPPATCVPELDVQPSIASPGETVTVSTELPCPLEPPPGGWLVRVQHVKYRVALSEWHASTPAATVDVPLRADGSLYAELTVPDDMAVGPASVGIMNYFELAPCPPNADCAGPFALLQISG